MNFESYQNLELEEPGAQTSSGNTAEFLLRCLLGAREEADFPSNEAGFDEDVNVYLVGLLGRFLSSDYHEEARLYLHPRDLDLNREVERSGDDRHAFRLYKTNADHLLLAIGIFHHVEGAHRPQNPLFHREPEEFIERGGIYYQLASSKLRRLRGTSTGPELTMRKLSDRFGRYVDVLQRVRSTYFHLTERLSDGTLYHLSTGSSEGAVLGEDEIKLLYDGFLDAYSAWNQDGSEENRSRLELAVRKLGEADQNFRFEMPSKVDIGG